MGNHYHLFIETPEGSLLLRLYQPRSRRIEMDVIRQRRRRGLFPSTSTAL
jgi:hypothetical protein